MLRTRTKISFAVSSLAPASILIARLDRESIVRKAKLEGALGVWVEPGVMFYALFFIGCLSLLLAVISTIVDVRRDRSLFRG